MEERTCNTNTRGVECLIVDKVYDACSKRECIQNMTFDWALNGDISEYTFLYAQFGDSEVEQYEDEPFFTEMDECHARLKCVVAIPIYAVLRRKCDCSIVAVEAKPVCGSTVQSDNKIRIPVSTVMDLNRKFVRQGRFAPVAECFTEANCVNRSGGCQISMTLGFMIVVSAVSKVSLKVPTFGYCPIPEECREEECAPNFCETFLSEDISAFRDFFPSNSSCETCGCDD